MTGHGFRGLATTIINDFWPTTNPDKEKIIDIQMAHLPRNKVRAAYDKAEYIGPRTEMMQWWADYVDDARKPKLKIVAAPSRRARRA